MSSLLEQLHDIDGLDAISMWPLALGWWILIAFFVLALCILIYFILRIIAFKRSWKNDTFIKLDALEKNLCDETAKDTVIALSEYLRRIALRRFPRKECAGLMGEAWLKWLSANDPKKFDWENKGILLIKVPYAPKNHKISSMHIKEIIQAVRNWVV